MQLILIAHRGGAAFEIAHIAALIGDDQGAFKLARIFGIDAEVGAELHRAAHAFWNINERAVRKDRAIERREIIVAHRHNAAEPFFHQLWIFADRLRDREEDDACLLQFLTKGGRHRHAIKDCINRDFARAFNARQHLLLFNRDAQFFIDAQNFRIDFVETFQRLFRLGGGVIIGVLIIDRRDVELRPIR